MSTSPDIAEQMTIVMQSIAPRDVDHAVEAVLQKPIGTITTDSQIRDNILPPLDLQPLEPIIMPSWASLDQILVAAQAISQPSFWEEMLQAADPAEAATLMGMMHVTAQNDLAQKISGNNGRFFSTSIAFMFLAAAAGTNAEFLLSPIGLGASSKKALDVAAQHFQTPAQTPGDFVDRLLTLFPDAGSDNDPNSAYRILLDNDAFERVSSLRGRNVCPIIRPTQLIFEGFGKILRTPQYQTALKQVVTK